MKKGYMALVGGGIALIVVLTLILSPWSSPTVQATNSLDNDNDKHGRDSSDHALSNGAADYALACRSNKAFTVYITARALTPLTLRVTFAGDNTSTDTIDYPLAAGQIVNITQSAGGTPDVDGKIVVSVAGGGPGTTSGLVAWMSMMTQSGAKGFDGAKVDYCRTYPSEAAARDDT